VDPPTQFRAESSTNDLKEMAPKMGLAAMPIEVLITSLGELESHSKAKNSPGGCH